jgi:hypothetical protein
VDRVHRPWTTGGASLRWTNDKGGGGGLSELLLTAGMSHGARHEVGKMKRSSSRFSSDLH